jgi:membrane associated rhomboid family serine protease
MIWLDKLERRFGFLGIPGLIRIVIGFTALVWALMWLNPSFRSALDLDPARIRHGEVWRLVTYIFVPQTLSFWIVLALWFLWFIGEALERAWGSFRLTLYFFVGMIGTTIAAFFYILFILPVKIKWLAWVFAAFLLVGFVLNSNSYRAALIAAFANYFIFFGPEIIHQARHRQEVSTRRRRFEAHSRSVDDALHHCAVCGATELTDPNLDFRVARDGEEYCIAHLPKTQTPG